MQHEQEKLVCELASLFAAFALSMAPGGQACVRFRSAHGAPGLLRGLSKISVSAILSEGSEGEGAEQQRNGGERDCKTNVSEDQGWDGTTKSNQNSRMWMTGGPNATA